MLYPQVSTQDWVDRYPDLKPRSILCQKCRKTRLETTQPFMTKRWVGLVAPTCACGYFGMMVFISRDPSTDAFLDSLAQIVTGN